jgi:hypothetical protein
MSLTTNPNAILNVEHTLNGNYDSLVTFCSDRTLGLLTIMRNALDDPTSLPDNGISELMDDLDQVSDTGFSFYRQDE